MNTNPTPLSRAKIVSACLSIVFIALMARFIHLQVLRHAELKEKSTDQRLRIRVTQSWRGPILDRHGTPLAVTQPVKTIYADLAVWNNRVDTLAAVVAPLLDMTPVDITQRVQRRLDSLKSDNDKPVAGAALLKRNVLPGEWAEAQRAVESAAFSLPVGRLSSQQARLLKRLRRWTLFADDDQFRRYPYGTIAAQTLGFAGRGTNGHLLRGKCGIEAAWNPGLTGENGERISSHDAAGNELTFTRRKHTPVQDGASVKLTIDLKLQQIVEEALAKVMAKHTPSNASCIVVQPTTGEILAMANAPTFNPERPADNPPTTWRNRVVSDRNEVGSVFKVVTLAAALDLGVTTLNDLIYCENGRWVYNGIGLRDGGRSHGHLTVGECLAKSSNIGLAKIAISIGPERFHRYITNFGFDRVTGVALPQEIPGFVRAPARWSGISATRLAIGHELTVSQISLAMAYSAIANGGKLMRPLLVSAVDHADGTPWTRNEPAVIREVIRPETARKVRAAMRLVVAEGTGTAAALPNHTVAGKTGTAQKSDGYRYIPGRHFCSFIGLAPALKPALVICVAVDEPQGAASGGRVAAPVFQEIAGKAMALYGIAPDKTAERPAPHRRRTSRPAKPLSPPLLARAQP